MNECLDKKEVSMVRDLITFARERVEICVNDMFCLDLK